MKGSEGCSKQRYSMCDQREAHSRNRNTVKGEWQERWLVGRSRQEKESFEVCISFPCCGTNYHKFISFR